MVELELFTIRIRRILGAMIELALFTIRVIGVALVVVMSLPLRISLTLATRLPVFSLAGLVPRCSALCASDMAEYTVQC